VSPRSGLERVQDILDAIAEIQTFVRDVTQAEFLSDPKTIKAVVADLIMIGEAARHRPDTIIRAHPNIPWPLIRGMRNRIVHAYFQIDAAIVWETCQTDLTPLVRPLQDIRDSLP